MSYLPYDTIIFLLFSSSSRAARLRYYIMVYLLNVIIVIIVCCYNNNCIGYKRLQRCTYADLHRHYIIINNYYCGTHACAVGPTWKKQSSTRNYLNAQGVNNNNNKRRRWERARKHGGGDRHRRGYACC